MHNLDVSAISHNSNNGLVGVSTKINLVFCLIADFMRSVDLVSINSKSIP